MALPLCMCRTVSVGRAYLPDFVSVVRSFVWRAMSCARYHVTGSWGLSNCNQLCVLLRLGLFKQRFSVIRRHLCEERPGSNSGKSCVLCLFVACFMCSVLCCEMLACNRRGLMFQILRSLDSCNKWLAAIDLWYPFGHPRTRLETGYGHKPYL